MSESPEFQKALQEACEANYKQFLDLQKTDIKTDINFINRRNELLTAQIMSNPHAREITENLNKINSNAHVCPICGETNSHGNKINGKPYCFKCQTTMINKSKVKNWIKPVPPKSWLDDFGRIDQVRRR